MNFQKMIKTQIKEVLPYRLYYFYPQSNLLHESLHQIVMVRLNKKRNQIGYRAFLEGESIYNC